MIIAAFDLATSTGCCDGPVGGKPRLWSWELRDAGADRPARLGQLLAFCRKYFDECPCDTVVYEAPLKIMAMMSGKFQMSEDTITFLRAAIGVIEASAYVSGKEILSVDVKAARRSALGWYTNRAAPIVTDRRGKQREETTKERVIREVKMLGHEPMNDNEADAYVLWQWGCNVKNPRLAHLQQPLFLNRL